MPKKSPKSVDAPVESKKAVKPPLKKQKAVKVVAKPVSGLAKWRSHLQEFRTANPKLSLKEAMISAKDTYHK